METVIPSYLTPPLLTWFNALLSCCSSFHTVFDTVVEFTTLERRQESYSDSIIEKSSLSESKQQQQREVVSHLFGIELVELCFLAVASPETQHLSLGAVGHVDELLVPPALVYGADVAAQNYTVITNLKHRRKKMIKNNLILSLNAVSTQIYKTVHTSMKKMSPVVSVPACTTNVCFLM